jgi:hypothetical protein
MQSENKKPIGIAPMGFSPTLWNPHPPGLTVLREQTGRLDKATHKQDRHCEADKQFCHLQVLFRRLMRHMLAAHLAKRDIRSSQTVAMRAGPPPHDT